MTNDTFIDNITEMLKFLICSDKVDVKVEIKLIRCDSNAHKDWVWRTYKATFNGLYITDNYNPYTRRGTAHFDGKNLTINPISGY